MADLFGFTITRKKDSGGASFTLPSIEDGAEDIAQGGFYSSVYDTEGKDKTSFCLLYTSPSPRDRQKSRMPSSA